MGVYKKTGILQRHQLQTGASIGDGSTFHGSHAAYSDWIENALKKINTSGATGSPLKQKMDDLAVFLRDEITKAYGNGMPVGKNGGTGKSLHEHFSPPFPAYK